MRIWNYNIPSNNRELLQRFISAIIFPNYYNIPSNNRELQHHETLPLTVHNYNIPSNNRELQQELQLHQ